MTERVIWKNRTPEEQALIEKLWQRKCAFLPVAAYCTTTQPVTLKHFVRWEHGKTEPTMRSVPVPAGQTLKVVMISRFEDFGLTEDLSASQGYGVRLPWDSPAFMNLREQP